MIDKLAMGIVALSLVVFTPSRAPAQDAPSQSTSGQKTGGLPTAHQGTQRLTGCILRGDISDNYKFNASDGTVWDISKTNKSLKIDPYVGHTVTLVGNFTPDPYSAKDEDKSGVKRDLSKNRAGMVDVSRVVKKGATCTQ